MIEKTFIERRVYDGAPVRRGYRVAGIQCVRYAPSDRPKELVPVQNLAEYSSGCGLHRGGCFGHMCETPTGSVLPPHSLSFRSGDVRTQYYIASTKAFESNPLEYIDEMRRTNYGKDGHLRSIMSTPVSGSARLVCVPHDSEDPRIVFVSENLASKILFCLPQEHEGGLRGSTYSERCLREGDYVMLERAPSLSKYNNQPFKLGYWDKECVGVHPKVFSYFHGDYDGDEVHIYALGSPRSVEEARLWRAPLGADLCVAEGYMRENFGPLYDGAEGEGDMRFLRYTTLSFSEVEQGGLSLPIGAYTRNKPEHLQMFRERLRSRPGTRTFLQDARKGVRDIIRQQVSQGKIGDMSRVARISSMCFTRGKKGGTYVVGRRSSVLLNPSTLGSTGSPAMRCVMVLCQASQEAALHAHRVGSVETRGLDLVSDLLKGRLEGGSESPCQTLYVLHGVTVATARAELGASWCCEVGGKVVAVAPDDSGDRGIMGAVVGGYSPMVLRRVEARRRKAVCRLGINAVFNYYGLRPEGDDLDDLVEVMCYKVSASSLPTTTRDGMFARGLGWMETVMACDYTKFPYLAGSSSGPLTATSATMCSNFRRL